MFFTPALRDKFEKDRAGVQRLTDEMKALLNAGHSKRNGLFFNIHYQYLIQMSSLFVCPFLRPLPVSCIPVEGENRERVCEIPACSVEKLRPVYVEKSCSR